MKIERNFRKSIRTIQKKKKKRIFYFYICNLKMIICKLNYIDILVKTNNCLTILKDFLKSFFQNKFNPLKLYV